MWQPDARDASFSELKGGGGQFSEFSDSQKQKRKFSDSRKQIWKPSVSIGLIENITSTVPGAMKTAFEGLEISRILSLWLWNETFFNIHLFSLGVKNKKSRNIGIIGMKYWRSRISEDFENWNLGSKNGKSQKPISSPPLPYPPHTHARHVLTKAFHLISYPTPMSF